MESSQDFLVPVNYLSTPPPKWLTEPQILLKYAFVVTKAPSWNQLSTTIQQKK